MEKLILTCEHCKNYVLYCCACSRKESKDLEQPCHHYRLIFTDGACKNNGAANGTAGTGIAFGKNEVSQISGPVTSAMDSNQKRTSQRAELLAAVYGLRFIAKTHQFSGEAEKADGIVRKKKSKSREPDNVWIITSDSEYLVKGMTEWLPAWKVSSNSPTPHCRTQLTGLSQNNNMRNGQNKRPTNIDLFIRLDELINKYEKKRDVKIGFWHVPRKYNDIADGLAKKAALEGEPCVVGHAMTE